MEARPERARANRHAGPREDVARVANANRFWRDGFAASGSAVPSARKMVTFGGKKLCDVSIASISWMATANPPKVEPERTMPPIGSVRPPPACFDSE